jgi:hypothetical protein
MDEVIIPFLPKLIDLEYEEYNAKLSEIRSWLDQYGRYGKLYMWDIGKKGLLTEVIGVRIFDPAIAILFKLTVEI